MAEHIIETFLTEREGETPRRTGIALPEEAEGLGVGAGLQLGATFVVGGAT
jgi:hypothetical protein